MIQRSLNKILLFTYNAIILTHLIKIPWLKQREFITLCYTIFFFSSSPGCSMKKKNEKTQRQIKTQYKKTNRKPI